MLRELFTQARTRKEDFGHPWFFSLYVDCNMLKNIVVIGSKHFKLNDFPVRLPSKPTFALATLYTRCCCGYIEMGLQRGISFSLVVFACTMLSGALTMIMMKLHLLSPIHLPLTIAWRYRVLYYQGYPAKGMRKGNHCVSIRQMREATRSVKSRFGKKRDQSIFGRAASS